MNRIQILLSHIIFKIDLKCMQYLKYFEHAISSLYIIASEAKRREAPSACIHENRRQRIKSLIPGEKNIYIKYKIFATEYSHAIRKPRVLEKLFWKSCAQLYLNMNKNSEGLIRKSFQLEQNFQLEQSSQERSINTCHKMTS